MRLDDFFFKRVTYYTEVANKGRSRGSVKFRCLRTLVQSSAYI